MSELSSSEITTLIEKLKCYPYTVSFGSTVLAPLAGAPSVEPEVTTKDTTLYETGEQPQRRIVTSKRYKITIRSRNVEAALPLLNGISKGDDLLATPQSPVNLTFVPITSATEDTITFGNARIQADGSFNPGENDDPSEVNLTFLADSMTIGSSGSSSSSSSGTGN